MDARAEERETLGLISIRKYSEEWGFSANCTLQPPSIFRARRIFKAEVFSMARSSLETVWQGATTMESPV